MPALLLTEWYLYGARAATVATPIRWGFLYETISGLAWLVALICICIAMPFAAVPASAESCVGCTAVALTAEEQVLWQGITDARAKAGLLALAVDAPTVALARDRSTDMARHHSFGHVSSAGRTFLDMMPAYGLTGQLAGETIQAQ